MVRFFCPKFLSVAISATRPVTAAAVALSLMLPVAAHAQAQAQNISFDIPAQALDNALQEFGKQAKHQVLYNPENVKGLKTAASLKGSMTAEEAITQLLQGTSLSYEIIGNTVTLRALRSETTLKKVVVQDSSWDATTEGSGSYTTRSANTATKLPLSLRETPQSVTVITRQRIDDQSLTQLNDIAMQTPGLIVNQTGNLGSDASQIYARGFVVENYQVDGVLRVYGGYSSLLQTNDMAVYDRAEIVRGATGLMNGVGTPSATINLIRKRATAESKIALKVEAGSWDYYRTEIDAGSALNDSGSVRGRVVAVYQENDSYIDRLHERKKILYGVVDVDITENTLASLGATVQDHDADGHSRGGRRPFFSDGTPTDWSRSDSSAASWATSERENQAYFAALEHHFANEWMIKATIDHAIFDYDEILGYANVQPNRITGAASLSSNRWVGKPVQDAIDLYANGQFSLFGQKHDLVFGISSSRTQDSTHSYSGWTVPGWNNQIPNIYTWNGDIPGRPNNPPLDDLDITDRIDSAYSSARFRVTDDLALIFGARVTNWVSNRTTTTYADGLTTKNNRSETGETTPYAAFVYDFSKNWSVYASYTDIFKPQSNQDADGQFLDPLLGKSYELGVKGELLDQRLNVGGALFQIEQDNFAVAIPGESTPNGDTAYEAVSGTKTRGYELELSGAVADGWQASAGFTRLLTKDRDDNLLNTNIPQNSAKLFATYRIASIGNGLTVGGGVRWQNEMWSNFAFLPGRPVNEVDSYAVVDLLARYPITEQINLSLNVNNLFDKEYLTNSFTTYYGAPRNAKLTLDVKF